MSDQPTTPMTPTTNGAGRERVLAAGRAALGSVARLASQPCEAYTSGTCADDASRSADAQYAAERYCSPCRLRAALAHDSADVETASTACTGHGPAPVSSVLVVSFNQLEAAAESIYESEREVNPEAAQWPRWMLLRADTKTMFRTRARRAFEASGMTIQVEQVRTSAEDDSYYIGARDSDGAVRMNGGRGALIMLAGQTRVEVQAWYDRAQPGSRWQKQYAATLRLLDDEARG
jgi:hypothetical protein